MKTIHLIRHGQAQAGTAHYDRLSPLGQTQAGVLSNFVKSTSEGNVDVWSGSLNRQLQTARIAHDLNEDHTALPQQHEGLNEYDHKAVHRRYDPRDHSDRDPDVIDHDVALDMTLPVYTKIIESWIQDSSALHDPRFESWGEFSHRTLTAVTEITQSSSDDTIFAYSSGGAISAIIAQLNGLTPTEIADLIWQMKNTSVTTLVAQNKTLELVQHNNIDHLHQHNPDYVTAI